MPIEKQSTLTLSDMLPSNPIEKILVKKEMELVSVIGAEAGKNKQKPHKFTISSNYPLNYRRIFAAVSKCPAFIESIFTDPTQTFSQGVKALSIYTSEGGNNNPQSDELDLSCYRTFGSARLIGSSNESNLLLLTTQKNLDTMHLRQSLNGNQIENAEAFIEGSGLRIIGRETISHIQNSRYVGAETIAFLVNK